jgi:hypothetical protein
VGCHAPQPSAEAVDDGDGCTARRWPRRGDVRSPGARRLGARCGSSASARRSARRPGPRLGALGGPAAPSTATSGGPRLSERWWGGTRDRCESRQSAPCRGPPPPRCPDRRDECGRRHGPRQRRGGPRSASRQPTTTPAQQRSHRGRDGYPPRCNGTSSEQWSAPQPGETPGFMRVDAP